MQKVFSTLLIAWLHIATFAQSDKVEMADTFRAEGKIYVVIGVFVIIVIVLFIYLFMIDRKIRKLEDQMKG